MYKTPQSPGLDRELAVTRSRIVKFACWVASAVVAISACVSCAMFQKMPVRTALNAVEIACIWDNYGMTNDFIASICKIDEALIPFIPQEKAHAKAFHESLRDAGPAWDAKVFP